MDATGGVNDVFDPSSFAEVDFPEASTRAQPEEVVEEPGLRTLGESSLMDIRAKAFTFDGARLSWD